MSFNERLLWKKDGNQRKATRKIGEDAFDKSVEDSVVFAGLVSLKGTSCLFARILGCQGGPE